MPKLEEITRGTAVRGILPDGIVTITATQWIGTLLSGVRSLNDWLAREFVSMIDTVRRNAQLAIENVAANGREMSKATVEHKQSVLGELATLLEELVREK